MLNCVIIDDEQPCIDVLKAMIQRKLAHRLTVAGSAREGVQALELIRSAKPDVVFLDVEMPSFSGLQLLSHFPDGLFSVVFTTAHLGYALAALKKEAVDYLLKPISLAELETAVEKCEKRRVLPAALHTQDDERKSILLHTGKGSILADLEEIIRFEACNNYCTVFFTGRPKLMVARTLKIFDDQLNKRGFFRLHQSHLVNLRHVKLYRNGTTSYAVLSNGDKVEIARRRKSDFLKIIGNK